ncbi:MAG: ABC transporter substrate-binding protein [Deltaproteobacteria bacterium]|nr:ABC transporter substrate-binding protein [Deltaproteobacteria bacterium]
MRSQTPAHRYAAAPLGAPVLALLLLAAPARAAQSPQQVIHDGAEKVRSVLKHKTRKGSPAREKQKAELKQVVDGFLDYRELARRSLGPHWKDRSPQEQTEFCDLLRELIEASYTNAIRDNVDFSLDFEEEEIADDRSKATVAAVASAKNAKGKKVSEDLTFQLFLKERKWMIYDVEFGDLSLVRHYRGEFNRKIKKESYAALIAVMKKKLDEIRSGKIEKKLKL